jgi:hypothetical protein
MMDVTAIQEFNTAKQTSYEACYLFPMQLYTGTFNFTGRKEKTEINRSTAT